MIKKAFSNKKDLKEFKDKYSNRELDIKVVSNLIQPSYKDKSVEIDNYFKFWFQANRTNDMLLTEFMFMISHYGQDALKDSFGKHDFSFVGNRKYNIYVLDFDGLQFTAPSKREVVVPQGEDILELINKSIRFENAYCQLVTDYLLKNYANLQDYEKENLDKMKKIGIIDENNQINFQYQYNKEPKKVVKKGM
jgi:hypothetical protein